MRVGIFSGTFDPVHKGHIAFAMHAIEAAGLDEVAFVPEPTPRNKTSVTHLGHRIAMLKLALKGHPKLSLLELPDKQFLPAKTLPRIRAAYPDATLAMLIGTDVLAHISVWPLVKPMLNEVGLIVAVRGDKDEAHARKLLGLLPAAPPETHVVTTGFPDVSSRAIRDALHAGHTPSGELKTINAYMKEHWLYARGLSHK
jgi:nicotinate-nucleotide adenylyltransferase